MRIPFEQDFFALEYSLPTGAHLSLLVRVQFGIFINVPTCN